MSKTREKPAVNPRSAAPPPRFTLAQRGSGVLLHVTSLPSTHGIGDLGDEALAFIDFLAAAGQSWWQVLPTHPAGPGYSPYSTLSAFAGYPLLVSLDRLVADGLLQKRDVKPAAGLSRARVAYPAVAKFKLPALRKAFLNFIGGGGLIDAAYQDYLKTHAAWLEPWAFFSALHERFKQKPWHQWPDELRHCSPDAIRRVGPELRDQVEFEKFTQYVIDRQWSALRSYAHEKGVGLLGDVPIFVAHNSADVWSNQHLFDLEADGRARTQTGCPPDEYSKTGQLWEHPQYRWERHQKSDFAWWLARFRRMFEQFDAVRIDHFLGFHRVWSIPGRDKTAKNGKWLRTPGRELLSTMRREMGTLEIVAEDLGAVTPEAMKLRDEFHLPGMRLLQFGWSERDEDSRYHQPHRHAARCVAYPGTHDNQTLVGWFADLRKAAKKRRKGGELAAYERVLRYAGSTGREVHWDLIRLLMASHACTAIIPAQDLLGLDNRARMNVPATEKGNWEWRLEPGKLTPKIAARLRELAVTYERIPPRGEPV